MSADSKIEWTTHTFSPWIGCTEVSPGCTNCYAREMAKRYGWAEWGAGRPRHRTSAATWRNPVKWNAATAKSGERPRVFPSLCDPFDNEVPVEWRDDFWALINHTPNLDWLLLTKRISNASKMVRRWPANVWLGISVVNQEEADRDIPKLLAVPARMRFLSCEPLLDDICLRALLNGIGWVIVGGESGPGARPMDVAWMRRIKGHCDRKAVPCFIKQMGSFVIDRNDAGFDGCDFGSWPAHIEREGRVNWTPFDYVDEAQGAPCRVRLRDRKGGDPVEWPEDLRVRQFPAPLIAGSRNPT